MRGRAWCLLGGAGRDTHGQRRDCVANVANGSAGRHPHALGKQTSTGLMQMNEVTSVLQEVKIKLQSHQA